MRLQTMTLKVAGFAALALLVRPASGQLFSEDFDVAPAVAWNINYGADVNVTMGGVKNEVPNFSFDYSSLGIPPAPSQTGSSTKGLQLKARLNLTGPTPDPDTGVSVSPNGESFTGNYKLTFDLWSNFNGAIEGGASYSDAEGLWEGGGGSTLFSTYGILSSGVGSNYLGLSSGSSSDVEALMFANSGDGQNGLDYRVHGPNRESGYRGTVEGSWSSTLDAGVTFADTYPANHPQGDEGTTNRGVHTPTAMELADLADDVPPGTDPTDGELYRAAFPSVAAPSAHAAMFSAQQTNTTMQGAMGMAWRQVEIKKDGNIVTWSVLNSAIGDGRVLLATIDLSLAPQGPGTNIMFGHSDGINGVTNDANWETLQFTLIDNVSVEAIASAENADFDDDDDVDGADFLIWQRNLGTASGQPLGNADGMGSIDGADLAIWQQQFGQPVASVAAGAVPEPGAWFMALVAAVCCLSASLPRRRAALAAANR